ncbi:hypothetical protein [Halomonas sp. B23F22_10]|uniref:hypothetical protein n=1 Tax=Halomonas sp. B23F22_10 TaxID=3459515 RepID=UPI00373F78D0
MSAAHPQLHYTCIFLSVSFRALRDDLGKAAPSATSPCWPDARLIEMLTGELTRCRDAAARHPAAWQSLDAALAHASLLLAQCPGGMDRERCETQIDAIITPLQEAAAWLSGRRPSRAQESHWQAATRRLVGWLGR